MPHQKTHLAGDTGEAQLGIHFPVEIGRGIGKILEPGLAFPQLAAQAVVLGDVPEQDDPADLASPVVLPAAARLGDMEAATRRQQEQAMTALHPRMAGQGGILGRLGAIDLVHGLAESQLARYPGQHLGQGVEALDFSVFVDGDQRVAQGFDQAMIP